MHEVLLRHAVPNPVLLPHVETGVYVCVYMCVYVRACVMCVCMPACVYVLDFRLSTVVNGNICPSQFAVLCMTRLSFCSPVLYSLWLAG